jgi:hypothetical protein
VQIEVALFGLLFLSWCDFSCFSVTVGIYQGAGEWPNNPVYIKINEISSSNISS